MASPFIIGRVGGDHPVRGNDDTVTRIRYQSPPPRISVTHDNDEDGLCSRKLIYEDRGVTGILQSTDYPRSKALTLLSRESLGKPIVRYEPRHTPPDCCDAQDDALLKAEILLQETQRAIELTKREKTPKSPRRDSAVSEDDESEPQRTVIATTPREDHATLDRLEQETHATVKPPKSHAAMDLLPILTTPDPHIIISTTEPHSPHPEEVQSSKRQKFSSSPKLSSPALPAKILSSKSRDESESRFVKPRTPSAHTMAAPVPARIPRGESVASVRSNDSRVSRQSRGTIKDDLTIDSKFGQDDDDLNGVEYLDKNGRWYTVIGQGHPDWALDSRRKVRVVASPGPRRGTGAWRNK